MREERLHALLVELYESRDPKLNKLCIQLQNPKYRNGLRSNLLNKKINALLGTLIDPASYLTLTMTEKRINGIERDLSCNEGWFASEYGVTLYDTAIDYEEEYYGNSEYVPRIFSIFHNENGYYVDETLYEPANVYQYAKAVEWRFLHTHQAILNELHELYKTKRNIMTGGYKVLDPSKAGLVELICEFFGYQKAPVVAKGTAK